MKHDYFHRVAALTPTKMWINNVTPQEADLAIAAGAMGCTQNPSYTWKMLNHEEGKDHTMALLDETLKESRDDNEVECILQRKLVKRVAERFMSVYERTNGRYGYVSIQGDPIHEEDPEVIIEEGRKNRQMSPNIMIKIPATKAGLKAMAVLIEENTPLNATEVMGLSQVIEVCEMYRKITARGGTRPISYYSLITGIYDEWIHKEVAAQGIEISPDILYQAGMVIAKKVYRLVHDRGYTLGFIGGGVRGLQHFTEMVGGDVCITMNWGGQADKLLELDLPVVARLFNPVQEHILDELLAKVQGFRQAYMEDGLEVEEYEEYGPVLYFRDMFIGAWQNTLRRIEERRREVLSEGPTVAEL
jgi:transaldolase